MAAETLDIVVVERGSDAAADKVRGVGTAASSTGNLLKQLQAQLSANTSASLQATTASQNLSSAMRSAASSQQQLASALNSTASGFSNTAGAASRAAQQTRQAGAAAQAASSSFSSFRNVLATVTAGFGIKELGQLLSRYQDIENKLGLVTNSALELKTVQDALLQSANANRVSYETMANSYAKVAQATKAMGLTQQQTLDFTDSLTKSLRISGASAQETASVLLQIPQALSSGRLNGDEFRSFAENNARGMDVLAKALGVSRGALKELAEEGKISAKQLTDAFIKALPQLRDEFAKTTPTLAQSFQVLGNSASKYVVDLDKAVGFSKALSQATLALAGNFATFAPLLLVAGGGIAVLLSSVGGLTGALAVMGRGAAAAFAFFTGPIGIVIAGLLALTGYLYTMSDQIRISGTSFATLADAARVVWEDIKSGVSLVIEAITSAFSGLASTLSGPLDSVKSAFKSAFGEIDTSWIGLVRAFASGLDTVIGAFIAAGNAIVAAWQGVPGALAELIVNGMNAVIASVEGALNKISGAINSVFGKLGVSLGGANLGRINNSFEGAGKSMGESIQKGVQSGFSFNSIRSYVDGVVTRADGAAKQRLQTSFRQSEIEEFNKQTLLNQVRTGGGKQDDVNKPKAAGGKGGGGGAKGNSLSDDLQELTDKLAPAQKALREFNEAKATLDKALAAGLINQQQYTDYLDKTKLKYDDLIDPLGKVNKDLDQEMNLLKLSNAEREIQNKLLAIEKDLREKGITLAPAERDALRTKIQGIQEFKKSSEFINEAFSTAFKGIESAIGELVTKGKIDFKDLVKSILADLAKLSVRQFVTQPLQGALSGFANSLFGGGGGGGGGGGNIFSSLFSSFLGGGGGGAVGPPLNILPFAEGGDHVVGGTGGIDSQLVAMRATPGEKVSVSRQGDGKRNSGMNVTFNITTPDAESFKQSQSQVAAGALAALRVGARNR